MNYNQDYFDWQKTVGAFGGMAEVFKFTDFIKAEHKVIDFGCGGGYLLSNIKCAEKIGVEINLAARDIAKLNGLVVFEKTEMLEDGWADVIISNHALEHTFNPLRELESLYDKLKDNGQIVFVIPHEIKNKYIAGDINQHLYTWSPMNAGNLFQAAGFKVLRVDTIRHQWPPGYVKIRKLFGQSIFDLSCRLYNRVKRDSQQIRVIAIKE